MTNETKRSKNCLRTRKLKNILLSFSISKCREDKETREEVLNENEPHLTEHTNKKKVLEDPDLLVAIKDVESNIAKLETTEEQVRALALYVIFVVFWILFCLKKIEGQDN